MTKTDELLAPGAYQARVQALQAEFQKKVQAAQAEGDFAAIVPLSERLRADLAALGERLKASLSVPAGAPPPPPATPAGDDDGVDAVPKDEETARLMLLGAMYVEENNMLDHMTGSNTPEALAERGKEIMISEFCCLDMNMSDVDPGEMRRLLTGSWGMEGREDLTNTLAWLLKEGHHKLLKQLISFCKTHPAPEERTLAAYRDRFDDPLAFKEGGEEAFQDALVTAERKGGVLPPEGIRGWDLARYAHVLRLGYMAGMMGADECWVHLRRLREPVVKTFGGWRDFAHSYMAGYQWWSGTTGPLNDACKRLLEHPKSPWTFFGWWKPG